MEIIIAAVITIIIIIADSRRTTIPIRTIRITPIRIILMDISRGRPEVHMVITHTAHMLLRQERTMCR